MFRRLIVLASTALITGALAGCGNTDSWVEAHAADGWPAQYGDAANSSYTGLAGADALDWSGAARSRASSAPRWRWAPAHYLAVNAQTPAGCSLMVWETDNNGRQRWCTRLWQGGGSLEPAVRRLRQPLYRSARRDDVVPADAVDPLAAAGDRNADHPKDSRARPAAGGDPSGSGAGVRRPPRHRDRHAAGSGGGRRPDRLRTRTRRLPPRPAALPGRRGARLRGAERESS